jgi:hypothetical protein
MRTYQPNSPLFCISMESSYVFQRNRLSGIRGLVYVAKPSTKYRVFIATGDPSDK